MSDHINDHTCTHHNDAQRKAAMLECPVCLLRERNEARDKVSDLVNNRAVLIALHRSDREELAEWRSGVLRKPCEHARAPFMLPPEPAIQSVSETGTTPLTDAFVFEHGRKDISHAVAYMRTLEGMLTEALDFAEQTLRAYEARDAAVAELGATRTEAEKLRAHKALLRERIERFVARVDSGTIKSTWTYELFKQALEETADVTPEQTNPNTQP